MSKLPLLGLLFYLSVCGSLMHGAPRVAVIGGGIGGTAFSYFFKRNVPGATIDIYERGKVGGRLATVSMAGREYESGGSIIHPANRVMVSLRSMCHLDVAEEFDTGTFSLNRGGTIIFEPSSWPVVSKLGLVWRYGLWSLLKIEYFVSNLLSQFANIYPALEQGRGFLSVADILRHMGNPDKANKRADSTDGGEMLDLTNIDLKSKLSSLGVSKAFINELGMISTKVNYGQIPSDLHAFVGSVSLAGVQGGLWRVKGGNSRIPDCLAKKSEANLYLGHQVNNVRRDGTSGKYTLEFNDSGQNKNITYDAVVVATPLTADTAGGQIHFEGVTGAGVPVPGRYHRTIAHVVQGRPNVTALGFQPGTTSLEGRETVFFIDPEDRLASLARLVPVDFNSEDEDGHKLPHVYKIFASELLSKTDLDQLFEEIIDYKAVDWLAYPHYESNKDLGNFELGPGLYYLNNIEWAASAMEMSAISGWNIANLITNATAAMTSRNPTSTSRSKNVNSAKNREDF